VAPKSTYSTLGRFLKMPQTRDAIAAYVRAYLPIVEDSRPQDGNHGSNGMILISNKFPDT